MRKPILTSLTSALIATAAILTPISASAAPLASVPAAVDSASSQKACQNIKIIGGRVAVRRSPVSNARILRVVTRNTILRSCAFTIGDESTRYLNKCSVRGTSWYAIHSSRRALLGYVPGACAIQAL
jgi:hypothetical protein